MDDDATSDLRDWLAGQVACYAAAYPRYQCYADVLGAILRAAAGRIAPLAIVQARPKSVASFAEKAVRKRATRPDPCHQFTDLCGARIIGRTRSEVDAMSRLVVAQFAIDWENSVDASQRLRPTEFGYRSVHYIVALRPDVDYGVAIPDEVRGLKAEVQLRTVAEHAYSDFGHDLTYKGAFALPLAWERELAGAAATLEEVDGIFSRVEEGMRAYATSYGRYLGEREARLELERLVVVLEQVPRNHELAERIARLAIVLGDWQRAIEVLDPFVGGDPGSTPVPVLRDLGTALCHAHRADPGGADYRRGQDHLERASASNDVDAICSLAGTWKGIDDARARTLYRRAFELDPADPYALGNYLELELERDPAVLRSVGPLIRAGIERCERHVTAGINLPWAHFDEGRFHLLLGEPYEALAAYAGAVASSTAPFMIEGSLASLERIAGALGESPGVDWARRLLLLGLAARFETKDAIARIRDLASLGAAPLLPPIVILAGGTDPRLAEELAGYAELLTFAFADFAGTIVSGGTTQGISGIAGDIARRSAGSVRAIGYLPALIPADATPDPDYTELRTTAGHGFSPLEPLQDWIDLVAAGIPATQLRVLGVNGGQIAALEYRIALALGATVGLIADSGREAGRLLGDERWASTRLIRLPADPEGLRAFVSPVPEPLPEPLRTTLGRSIHQRSQRDRGPREDIDPSLADWDRLLAGFRESSCQQADHIGAKLRRIGCAAVPAGSPGEPAAFTPAEIELLAALEHGRWMAERLLAGWTLGAERNVERRTSPYLVTWSDLAEPIRDIDRQAVRRIPDLLAEVGLSVRRAAGGRAAGGRTPRSCRPAAVRRPSGRT
jgi:ppGpp synthetase/RelA/SpoT-type nucleotidyltranferase